MLKHIVVWWQKSYKDDRPFEVCAIFRHLFKTGVMQSLSKHGGLASAFYPSTELRVTALFGIFRPSGALLRHQKWVYIKTRYIDLNVV